MSEHDRPRRAKSEGIPAPIGDELSVPMLVPVGAPPPQHPRVRHYNTLEAFAEAEARRLEQLAQKLVDKSVAPLIARLDAIDDIKSKLMLLVLGGLLGAFVKAAVS